VAQCLVIRDIAENVNIWHHCVVLVWHVNQYFMLNW